MHLLYPSSPLRPRRPDEQFEAEVQAVRDKGFEVSLFSLEAFQGGEFRAFPSLSAGQTVLYRGWMLSAGEYTSLVAEIERGGCFPLTNAEKYLACHHLPNWYPLISESTPETRIYPPDCDLAKELKVLGWDGFFIKDYVKSLKTPLGSRVLKPENVDLVVAEMKKYRGQIEGGFCVRRIEQFLPDTERRYFVINAKPFSQSGEVPEVVNQCAHRIGSRFFSVDVIQRSDGGLRIVEIGDGQVSDLVGWTPERFADALHQGFQA